MVIFHSYVSLPEGSPSLIIFKAVEVRTADSPVSPVRSLTESRWRRGRVFRFTRVACGAGHFRHGFGTNSNGLRNDLYGNLGVDKYAHIDTYWYILIHIVCSIMFYSIFAHSMEVWRLPRWPGVLVIGSHRIPIGFPSDSHGHKKTFTLGAARLTWIPSVFPSQLLGLPVIPLISRYFKTPKTPKTRQLFEIRGSNFLRHPTCPYGFVWK